MLALASFACGIFAGLTIKGMGTETSEEFEDYQQLIAASIGSHDWLAGTDVDTDTMEVTVYIKEDSGVPVTKEFVEASVKNTEGYTLKGVYTSPFTFEELLEKMQIIKTIFREYGSDEVWGETPWLICKIATDEEHGMHIQAAINDPIWGQAGYTDSDKNSLVACVNMICTGTRGPHNGCVVWVDYIEPHRGFSLATYAQYPYNEEMM